MVLITLCKFPSYILTFINFSLPTSFFQFYGGFDPTTFTLSCPFSLPHPPGKQEYLGFPQSNSHLLQFVHFLSSSWPLVLLYAICNLMASHSSSRFKKSFLHEDCLCLFNLWLLWPSPPGNYFQSRSTCDSANPDAVTLGKWWPSLGLIERLGKNPGDHSILFSQNIRLGHSGAP